VFKVRKKEKDVIIIITVDNMIS